jgi:HK97 gp10 family phage protein
MSIRVKYNRLPQAKDVLQQQVETAFTKFLGDAEANADAITPVDTGHLKNDKTTEVSGMHGSITWHAEYALYVHEGTRYQGAQPFASDGFEKAVPSLIQAFEGMEDEF